MSKAEPALLLIGPGSVGFWLFRTAPSICLGGHPQDRTLSAIRTAESTTIKEWQCGGERQKCSTGRCLSNTESLRQCSHPRIRTNHSHSKRSQQPAGCTWGTATGADEIDRNQHLARERDSVRHKLCDRRRREGLAPEQLKIDQGSITFADCHSEEGRKQNNREK